MDSLIFFAQAAETESSLLYTYITACGPLFGLLFLLVSIAFVTLTIMNWLAISRNAIVPAEMLEQFYVKWESKEYQEAYDVARESDSVLGKILAVGLVKMSADAAAEQAMNDAAEEEVMRLQHRLSYLGTIASVAPMLGLLGTVWGMVGTFNVIAQTGTPQPSDLAKGISMALVTTQIGLLIAIPALVLFEIFKNRLAQFVLELDVQTAQVIKHLAGTPANKQYSAGTPVKGTPGKKT